jgi:hypothetical protein
MGGCEPLSWDKEIWVCVDEIADNDTLGRQRRLLSIVLGSRNPAYRRTAVQW